MASETDAGGERPVTIQITRSDDNGGGSLDLSKLAGIAVGIGFSIGLLYNLGFFLEIDARLFPLLTYKDHLETLVIFTPLAIVPILVGVGLRARPARRRQASIAAVGLGVLAIAAWTERGEIAGATELSDFVIVAVALVAFLLVAYCAAVILDRGLGVNDSPTDEAGRGEAQRALTVSIAGLLVFVTLLGAAQAHIATRPGAFDTQLTLTAEGSAAPAVRPTHLVRAIDNGLLVVFRDAPGEIAYVRNEAVRSLAEPARP